MMLSTGIVMMLNSCINGNTGARFATLKEGSVPHNVDQNVPGGQIVLKCGIYHLATTV